MPCNLARVRLPGPLVGAGRAVVPDQRRVMIARSVRSGDASRLEAQDQAAAAASGGDRGGV